MYQVLLLALFALVPVAVEPPQNQVIDKDRDLLQGTWIATSHVGFDESTPTAELQKLRLTIQGNQLTAHYGDKTARGTFALRNGESHRQIDVTLTEAPGNVQGKTVHGIYLIEGKMLRVAFTAPGEKRPTDFATAGQTRIHGLVFNRQGKR